ncbi:unnamed protein product [Allacma fusca]|uniref:Transcription factor BTF3 n=1 Tax=Allacma fusca TaxID=39272 RepID=A0A8J2LSN5_9HEXA|nr:unnamed protein product [Allacma fusca]
MINTLDPFFIPSSPGTATTRSKKSVNIANTTKSSDDWDLLPRYTGSKDLRQLNTSVPFYLEKDGYIINDLRDDNLNPSCSNSSVPSARAPSDDLLSPVDCRNRRFRSNAVQPDTMSAGTSLPKFPFQVEHSLTLEEIQAGLKTIRRTQNGYDINFSHLDISDKGLIDISLAERFSELKSIDLSCNYIQDVKALGSMPYLKSVNASKNDIQIFGDFRPPVALQHVNFSRNKIFKVVNLDKLWALTEVNLSHNNLEIADGFEQCKSLRVLDLSHNQISNIRNLDCKNLMALFLHNNKIQVIMDLTKCCNLRALSLAQNQIEVLDPLHNLTNLQELWLQSNKISDIHELRHFKSLLKLTSLFVEPNPFNSIGLWRRMLIFTLPQLRAIDGNHVTAQESLEATNTFNPSLHKISYENRMAVLLDRTCQAMTQLLDDNIHSQLTLPPILLLVGAPMSYSFKLSTLLKDKFKTRIQLGGVHSTVTTLELPNTTKDIPVSFDGFIRMKNRGEFLAYSHILGRICGFATSQITRASERNAVLVASVPIGIAITLRQWNIRTKAILLMPTGKINIKEIPKETINSTTLPESDTESQRPSEPTSETGIGLSGSSYWSENVLRVSKQTIGFKKEKTHYDLDEPGSKTPSLESGPYLGHTCLKNKDDELEDNVSPEVKLKSSVFFKTSQNLPPSSTVDTLAPSQVEENPGDVISAATDSRAEDRESECVLSTSTTTPKQSAISAKASDTEKIFPSVQQSEIVPSTSAENENECTEPKISQFLTEPKGNPEFSTVRQLQKLRRIASLLMEVSDREKVFEEFSTLTFGLDQNIDWKQALTELQMQDLKSTEQAYCMLINRLGTNANKGIKSQKFFETCLKPPKLEDVKTAKAGDFELVFMKDIQEKSGHILQNKSSRFVCANVQGKVVVEKERSESEITAAEGDQAPDTPDVPKESKPSLTSRPVTFLHDPREDQLEAPSCSTVVNPNYAFGPHMVCCEGNQHPICSVSDVERGTFYQGTFRKSFLDSSCSSISSTSLRNEQDSVWYGEFNDDMEGLFEDHCRSNPRISRESSIRFYNGRSRNTLEIQQLSDLEISGEFETEYPQSAPPPPSQNSCSGCCRTPIEEEEEEEEPSSPESETEIQTHHEHTSRRHRETTQTCILNEREKYAKFHQDNPGFFAQVIDSDRLDECIMTLSETLEEMISTLPKRSKVITYANENKVDVTNFMKQRMGDYRNLANGFSKGKPAIKILQQIKVRSKWIRRNSQGYRLKSESEEKLSVSTIPGIEEVNMIKDDGTVIHFNNPKVQASLGSNVFAVTGHGETKEVADMLPAILSQMGPESLEHVKRLAYTGGQQRFPQMAGLGGMKSDPAEDGDADDSDDEEVPDLVSNFDEPSKDELNVAKSVENTSAPAAAVESPAAEAAPAAAAAPVAAAVETPNPQ